MIHCEVGAKRRPFSIRVARPRRCFPARRRPVSQTERLHKLKRDFDAGRCLSRAQWQDELGVSFATLKRDLAYLRDRLNMPIVFDRSRGGWRLDRDTQSLGPRFEVPSLWLSAQEVHALLTMQRLLADLDADGLLAAQVDPLMQRLAGLLNEHLPDGAELGRRIRVLTVGSRPLPLPGFQAIGSALLLRRRLAVDYVARGSGARTTRVLSPQRLVHYRDNWYLDAWCHLREGLRNFSVDAIGSVRVLDERAVDVPDADVEAELGAGYGIFSGREIRWATLRFAPEAARWVARERWHRDQRSRFEADGCYVLELPYSDPRELVMDLMRHVPGVDVVAPDELREALVARVRAAAARWRDPAVP